MKDIKYIKKVSIWIFIIPFLAINLCLIIVTNFHQLLAPEAQSGPTFPYFDGGLSISRTARFFPTYLIFKPAMLLTAILLIQYWRTNYKLMRKFLTHSKLNKFFLIFGIGSAIFLILHSIFLGIKFDYTLYKLFRRFILLAFILFELAAQAFFVKNLFIIKNQINKLINKKILIAKIILVSLLIIVAIITLPIVVSPGNVHFKHALEWNYFVGIISFYLLTHLFWKDKIKN